MGNNSEHFPPTPNFKPQRPIPTLPQPTPAQTPATVRAPQFGKKRAYEEDESLSVPGLGGLALRPEPVRAFGKEFLGNQREMSKKPQEETKVYFESRQPDDARAYREAVQMLDEHLMLDEKYVELERELMLETKEGTYAYGANEMRRLAEVPIPGIVVSQYHEQGEGLQCCLSGIWPQLSRVYITINNQIFLWNYANGTDVARFEPVNRPIEAVALGTSVGSLARILPPNAPYAVWIATDTEIRLFGLQLAPALDLVDTDFAVPAEGDKANKIVSTISGRVFCGGSEGRLNELNCVDSWLGRRPKMVKQDRSVGWLMSLVPGFFVFGERFLVEDIVIDETRHTLYALMQRHDEERHRVESRVGVYDLGAYGTGFAEVCKIEQSELDRKIRAFDERIRGEECDRVQLAALLPLDRSYSESIQLMLLLHNGTRVYLSFETKQRDSTVEIGAPERLCETVMLPQFKVAAVRFPPSVIRPAPGGEMRWDLEIAGMPNPPEGIRQADRVLHSQDCRLVLLSDSQPLPSKSGVPGSALLLLGSNEAELAYIRHLSTRRAEGQLRELLSCVEENTNGTVTDLAEEPLENGVASDLVGLLGYPEASSYVGSRRVAAYSMCCMSSMAKGVYMPAREYYALTTQTLSTFVRPRPIDQLCSALNVPEAGKRSVDNFVAKYGRVETCALLLQLMCNPTENYWVEVFPADPLAKGKAASKESELVSCKPPKAVVLPDFALSFACRGNGPESSSSILATW